MAYGNEKVIIGITCGSGHNSGASIIVGNKLIAAIEEERLTRRKHDFSFPSRSIKFCIERGKIAPEKVDYVIIGWNPHGNWIRRFSLLFYGNFLNPRSLMRKALFFRHLYFGILNLGRKAQSICPNAKLLFVNHHLAHAASTFYLSPFNESAILTLDGRGECSTGLLAYGQDNKINKHRESFFPQSLGVLFLTFTQYLGFKVHDEYKVMGLAAYGKPSYLDEMRKIFWFSPKKIFQVDLNYIQHPSYSHKCDWGENYWTTKLRKVFGAPRKPSDEIKNRHMDIAASLQTRLNEVGVEISRYLLSLTPTKNLCLAGGVCLNGIMNYQIYQNSGVENIFIQPASGDGGISLGAALHVYHQILGNEQRIPFPHAYWGNGYSNDEIEKELRNWRIKPYQLKNTSDTAARLLAAGKILGWFQGRCEIGPRALGNRSILADPRPAENKDIVNARIKFREEFRPFAPSVLEEYAADLFELDTESPYMLMILKVREKYRSVIKAVTHVDGTTRPQTVSKSINPKYYALIESFNKITGCPAVLNTSFNVKGEPIVNSPSDALRCFFSTGLDYLVMGDFILSKILNYDEVADIENSEVLSLSKR